MKRTPHSLDRVSERSAAIVPGLFYEANFIDAAEEVALFSAVDAAPWLNDLRRRVQHYGWRYDYKARRIVKSMRLGDLPGWAIDLAQRLCRLGLMSDVADQVIVNEYLPGQGIAPHTDCPTCFGNEICSVSLGSPVVMDFVERASSEKRSMVLEARSVVALTGSARTDWTHGIVGRKSDTIQGARHVRGRRVSLTFRKVRLID